MNTPLLYDGNPVGVVAEVNEDVVKGFIYDMKFYQEHFVDGGKIASTSFEIVK